MRFGLFFLFLILLSTIASAQVTNITITPNLSITRFSDYNISAVVSGNPTSVTLNFTHYTNGVQSCFEYNFDGVCLENDTYSHVMSNLSASYWYHQVRPDDLYPAMEFIDDLAFWNHSNQLTDIRNDAYMIFNITAGFSTYANMSIFVEIDARADPSSDRELELYVISWDQPFSIFNSSWQDNASAVLLCTIGTNDVKDHTHNDNSSHHVCPITIGNDNLWQGLNLSNGMYVAVHQARNQISKAWDMAYLNSSKCNQSTVWYIGDYDAGSYTYTQGCPALHLHAARRTGVVDQMFLEVYDGTSYNSTLISFGALQNVAPNPLGFLTPTGGIINQSYNVTTNGCVDPNGDALRYNLSLYSTAGVFISNIADNLTTPWYYWNTSTVSDGAYDLVMTCCDTSGLCGVMYQSDAGDVFYVDNIQENRFTTPYCQDFDEMFALIGSFIAVLVLVIFAGMVWHVVKTDGWNLSLIVGTVGILVMIALTVLFASAIVGVICSL